MLALENKTYVWTGGYETRALPKAAGFRWDGMRRRWWTDRREVAAKLAEHADPALRAELETVAQERASVIEASRAADADVEIPAPDGRSYFGYQRAGIAWAASRPNSLIGDEMGLGKTIQAIGAINLDTETRRVLVICPAFLRLNWKREMDRWLVRPLDVRIEQLVSDGVCVCSYEWAAKHEAELRARDWDLLICDEAHYLKNPKAKRTTAILGVERRKDKPEVPPMPAKRRIFLTGTPVLNRPVELWPLLRALAPEEFPSFFGFAKRYCAANQGRWGWDFSGASHLDELQEKLRTTIMVRRLKRDVLPDLPAKIRQVIELPLNGCADAVRSERAAYDRCKERIESLRAATELAKASDSEDAYKAAVQSLREGIMAAFTELSKERHALALSKLPAVLEHLDAMIESGEKVVIFAHHRDVAEQLAAHVPGSVLVYGGMSDAERQAAVDRFQGAADCALFVGTIGAAGLGLTLTAASRVIFAELDWTPARITQAEDRCHRIGQSESVLVQHLVVQDSLDATMAQRLIEKQAVADAALDDIAEPVDMPLLPEPEPPATHDLKREALAKEAESMTPEQIAAVRDALQILAGLDPDHAATQNGIGFNRLDGRIGHDLAAHASLTPKQAALGRRLCRKYHRQLGAALVAAMGENNG